MLVTLNGIVDSTHPDSRNFTLIWGPSRKLSVLAIEAINRTSPCSEAIIIRDKGTNDNYQGCCLMSGTALGLGFPLCWNNYDLIVDEYDEIAVIFQNCLTGDVVNVHIHTRRPE